MLGVPRVHRARPPASKPLAIISCETVEGYGVQPFNSFYHGMGKRFGRVSMDRARPPAR